MTGQAQRALRVAEVVVGYEGYFPWVEDLVAGKLCLALPLTQEIERARLAVEHLRRGQEVLARQRPPDTPVGVVRNAYRPGQSVEVTTVARMAEAHVDMFTTVIAGSSQTRRLGPALVTPRGYAGLDRRLRQEES